MLEDCLVAELNRVWVLVLLLKRDMVTKGKRLHLLDIQLRIEYFNL